MRCFTLTSWLWCGEWGEMMKNLYLFGYEGEKLYERPSISVFEMVGLIQNSFRGINFGELKLNFGDNEINFELCAYQPLGSRNAICWPANFDLSLTTHVVSEFLENIRASYPGLSFEESQLVLVGGHCFLYRK